MSTDSLRCRASLLFPLCSVLCCTAWPLLLAEMAAATLGSPAITLASQSINRWLVGNGCCEACLSCSLLMFCFAYGARLSPRHLADMEILRGEEPVAGEVDVYEIPSLLATPTELAR